LGKLPTNDLKKLLAPVRSGSDVIVPPMPGYDSGVHLLNDKCVVVSTDPCLNVPEQWFGWLLVHFAASDVALFGASPKFCAINLLAAPVTCVEALRRVMSQAAQAADELGMSIVTGHTGMYEEVGTLIGVCTAYGIVERDKLITPGNAKAEDMVLCTKMLGLEALVNFALMQPVAATKLFGREQAEKLGTMVPMQSCVKEALLLAETGKVHAMHDATEGGLLAALNELADASGVGFRVEYERILISNEAKKLQKHFGLTNEQMLALSSTGCVVAAVEASTARDVKQLLQDMGYAASIIGTFTQERERIIIENGVEKPFPTAAEDLYDRILSSQV